MEEKKVVPMIHVPDVRAIVDWYESIGFNVFEKFGDADGGLSFAILEFGSTRLMFNAGGRSGTQDRREVDLYVYVDDVDELYQRLKDRVEVLEELHDTFYGMREFIIRDPNRFWITFGQDSAFEVLMKGVREGKSELVRAALEVPADKGGLKPETLTVALAAASVGHKPNAEIVELLLEKGAVPPPKVDSATLQSYVSKYKGDHGLELKVTVNDGQLFVEPAGQEPLQLLALDVITFRPFAFDDVTITFNVENGKTIGCAFKQGSSTMQLQRVEETR
jgi:uncharacterized glyoxalase superfamily protein PhnB